MEPRWIIGKIDEIQRNEIKLNEEKEQLEHTYETLLTELTLRLKEIIKTPGGGYIPPLSKEAKKKKVKELKLLKKYLEFKVKSK